MENPPAKSDISIRSVNKWKFHSINYARSRDSLCTYDSDNNGVSTQQRREVLCEEIVPSEKEKQIFDTLLRVNQEMGLGNTLRVAGGWVRNKLLGIEKTKDFDIDIALDKMSGFAFSQKMLEFFTDNKLQICSIGIIKANPDQSKHLETATTHIFGESIDIVNLRSETYAYDSRIPTIEIGTPLQDALRRDFTINSLFYNLHTKQVEDFSGKGIEDLHCGRVRTPLPPHQTFIDDPLRVIRCVRFACQFHFDVEGELIDAAKRPDVHKALIEKVSRERIGVEMKKILKGPDPIGAFALFSEMQIVSAIFTTIPSTRKRKSGDTDVDVSKMQAIQWKGEHGFEAAVAQAKLAHDITLNMKKFEDENYAALMLSALLYLTADVGPVLRRGFISTYEWCITFTFNSLRMPKSLCTSMAEIMHGCYKLIELFKTRQFSGDYAAFIKDNRLAIGRWLFNFVNLPSDSRHRTWREQFVLAQIMMHQDKTLTDQKFKSFSALGMISALEQMNEPTRIKELKPLLKGDQIAARLGVRPGKILSVITQEMLDWQIANPEQAQSEQSAEQWLQEHKDRFLAEALSSTVPPKHQQQ